MTLSVYVLQTPTEGRLGNKESIIYIFGCLQEGCGGGKGSWKVFRWTESDSDAVPNSHDVGSQEDSEESHKPCKDAWGLDADEEDAFDLNDLEIQLKLLGEETKASSGRRKKRDHIPSPGIDVHCLFDGWLPSFYLVHSGDIASVSRKSEGNSDDDDADDDDSTTTREAIEIAESEEDVEDTGDAGVVSWEGESYEQDVVLRATKSPRSEDDVRFLRFMKQLSLVPDQCMRVYSVESNENTIPYLWPSQQRMHETSCSYCGSPRICVAQCMSPIISALDEAHDMTESCEGYKSTPYSWNWATLAISVCRTSCTYEHFVEEHVDVIGEA